MTVRPPRRAGVPRPWRQALLVAATAVLAAGATRSAWSQGAAPSAQPVAERAVEGRAEVPWRVGERSQYEVRFGKLKVGSGSIEVVQLDEVRGREAWHTRFKVRGGTFFYRVNDVLESWIDTRTLASLRFIKDQEEGRRDHEVRYEIFPERAAFEEVGAEGGEQPSVSHPLDDGSFLFFVRTMSLTIGDTLVLNSYFKPDRNPVRIRVLRRERITVPAGTFDAIVVQPTFRTKGIFSENGHAEVWLSDDPRRIVLQVKSSLKFGSLNMYLKSHEPGGASSSDTSDG